MISQATSNSLLPGTIAVTSINGINRTSKNMALSTIINRQKGNYHGTTATI
jgi:hypothetical protein